MSSEIKLKLISGNKVILADCLGFETELFVPVIINNRIVLQNAVLSRRCCNQYALESIKVFEKIQSNDGKCPISQQVPLANSTPTHKTNKENKSNTSDPYCFTIKARTVLSDESRMNLPKDLTIKPLRKLQQLSGNKIAWITPTSANSSQHCNNTSTLMNRYPTPDIVRRAPMQPANETIPLPQYPQVTELKIVRLHRVNTPNTPKNLAKIVRSKTSPFANTSNPRVLRNLSNVSSFGTPPSLQRTKETNAFDCGSPNQSFLVRRIKTPGSATKWRKCITPQRTYIRHSNGQKTLPLTTHLQPLQLAKNGKLIDNYRIPINLKNRIIYKRRKLIIDNDLKITPRKFKKQLINTEDLNRSKSQLPKSRRHFYLSHMTAFDLLTNSSFYPKIGNKLNTVFRQGCVNKSAATILKYKQLTKGIPLLEESNKLF